MGTCISGGASVGDKIELTVTIDAREHKQHGRNRIEPKLR
jgi:hypothetical protein